MILWLVFTLMTAAAVLAVLVPLARRAPEGGGTDIAVYRDQLDEIARDRAAGLIGEQEAEAAKVEVSRRLIAAADAAGTQEKAASAGSPVWRRRWTAIAGLVLVPVSATTLYLMLGSPQLPGEPLQARLRAIHGDHSIESLVVQVEQHLARNPKDARGYAVLAPVYMQLGRFQDAVRARRKVIALSGETAERQADLGEALTAAANGVVTAEAKKSFERALALDAKNYKARFFEGMAAEQDGKTAKAAAIWGAMLKDAPPGARWVSTVRQALAQIGGKAPAAAGTRGPSAAEVAAANKMSPQN
ncbi:MAG: c-type cytochrome biogenesis protein CcmI, partial [Pseudolabrys sp.]